jgi:hypothetical protein
VNRFLKNLVGISHIAVDDILMVIEFVDVALPSAVVAFHHSQNPLV